MSCTPTIAQRPFRAQRKEPGPRVAVKLAADDEPAVLEGLQDVARHGVLRRPRERQTLDAFGVRVLRGGEAAFR